MTRTASCVCGKLRVTCAGEPSMVSMCHCLACQKRTGSTYGIAAFFARGDVRIGGQSKSFTRQGDSGFPVTFHFCPDCGANVFWEPQRAPGKIAVAVGAFADPAFPAPTKAVYVEHRHAWLGDAG